jgi:hypothetical protein
MQKNKNKVFFAFFVPSPFKKQIIVLGSLTAHLGAIKYFVASGCFPALV